jgi:adsorption protein B
MDLQDWLVLWRDGTIVLTWVTALLFLIGGVDDLIYDLGAWLWKIVKHVQFRDRERLTLAKLRSRGQQRIAVFVPAWNEGEIVGKMVENIIDRVEYRNYTIFVGTYPNDPATQQAVDALAAIHPQVVKVVTDRPGPTSKADCLNTVYRRMKQFERDHGVTFDLMAMHDAEDLVHPYGFLLYNYLIPRVDVIQLPILPLPTSWREWIHWTYADEFAENHLKDMIVREKMAGFVPFAGVGTGFSRRALAILEAHFGEALFNESSLTEDYSLGKKIREAGLQTIFAHVILHDPAERGWRPLAARKNFISNWSYFPMDFTRAVRQKTRWIIGISLQEWEHSGWAGSWTVKLNLFKDRKVFLAFSSTFFGLLLLGYFGLWTLGARGWLPFQPLLVLEPGSPLYTLVLIDTSFMAIRMFERVLFVSFVYGPLAGLLALPRLILGNIVNGLAAYRALTYFLQARATGARMRWDKTDHVEGIGALPATQHGELPPPSRAEACDPQELLVALDACERDTIIAALERIPRDLAPLPHAEMAARLVALRQSPDNMVRAYVARVSGFLRWPELYPGLLTLLYDHEWLVRANAAKALLRYPDLLATLQWVMAHEDRFAWEILIRSLEQTRDLHHTLTTVLHQAEADSVRAWLLTHSRLLNLLYPSDHPLRQPSPKPLLAGVFALH